MSEYGSLDFKAGSGLIERVSALRAEYLSPNLPFHYEHRLDLFRGVGYIKMGLVYMNIRSG